MRKNTFSGLLNQITENNKHLVFIYSVLGTSLSWSLFLTSASVVIILGITIIHFYNDLKKNGSLSNYWFGLKTKLKRLDLLHYASVATLFILTLSSGLWTHNPVGYYQQLRIKVPLFILPLCFAVLPRITKKQFERVILIIILFLGFYTLYIIIDYLLHTQVYTQLLYFGQSVPHIRDHIRFSILCAWAFMAGLIFFEERRIPSNLRIPIIFSLVTIFIALHVISARSGLLIMYAGIFAFIFWLAFKTKRFAFALSMIAFLLAFPIFAYYNISSFKQKIEYVLWDNKMQQEGKPITYSDGERWISNTMGLNVIKLNPVVGTSAGDYWQNIESQYAQQAKSFEAKMPHNQCIVVAGSFGVMGLLVFLCAFIFLWSENFNKVNTLKFFFFMNMFLAFFFDIPLEAEFGIVFYAFFASLLIQQRHEILD